MGFMDVMGRMVRGEPAFQDEDSMKEKPHSDDQPASPPSDVDSGPTIRKNDAASYPKVYLDRQLDADGDVNHMIVRAQVSNEWPREVFVDKITIFGATRELDRPLAGGKEYDFELYNGPALTKEYPQAILQYRTEKEGDYFQSVYRITYTYDSETGVFVPNEARFERFDDIYG